MTHDPGNNRRLLFPQTIYEQVDPLFLVYIAYRLEDRRVRRFPTKPGHFVQAEPFVGSRKRHGRIWLGLGCVGAGLGVWVVVANGVADNEVDERTDADPGTAEDYDDVWFSVLEGRRLSENRGEQS